MKFKNLIMFIIIAIVFMAFGLPPITAQETIKIGLVTPLTGGGSLFGLTARDGFSMALEELNAKGGVNGKKLEPIIYDSQSKPPIATTLAQRLIYEDKVVVVIGSSNSLEDIAIMEVTERAKFPLFCSSAASPLITEKGYKWVWRMSLNDKVAAEVVGKYINQKATYNKVALLHENTDYGRPPCEIVAEFVKKSGKQVVAMETYNRGDTDMSGQLWKIKSANPDFLLTWGYYTEAALIARQAKQIGLKAQLMGNASLVFPEYIDLAGPAAEGVLFEITSSTHINPDPKIQAFVKRYEEKFHRTPSITSVDYYDGNFVIAEVLKKVGTKANEIQNALNTMTFEGISETIKFDSRGQAVRGAIIGRIEGKNFKFLEYIAPGAH
jgi:branched-chain amino acid transport system substrate-binding protein